tara:strand:- start:783 stop:1103 length:321 start_codon:yes stop_codon:yes gene_type:complete
MNFLNLHWFHLILAFGGMTIHVLMKLGELTKSDDFSVKDYFEKYKFNMLASILMIPLLLLMATDTSLTEILPLNNVTAVLMGWTTNSTFKALMGIYSNKLKTNDVK